VAKRNSGAAKAVEMNFSPRGHGRPTAVLVADSELMFSGRPKRATFYYGE
jgi:hypothetical protein